MKAVLISIQPKWCELIASGNKTVEVRKTRPKIETPFKVYIYQTKESKRRFLDHRFNSANNGLSHYTEMGKVIGEFVCNEITVAEYGSYCVLPKMKTLIDVIDLLEYADEKTVFGWHISDLIIYDKPKELSEFRQVKKLSKTEYRIIGNYSSLISLKADYKSYARTFKGFKYLTRPPQSWCYVEELE